MGSEERTKVRIAVSAVWMALMGVLGGAHLDSPRIAVLAACIALALLLLIGHDLQSLRKVQTNFGPEVLPLTADQQALLDQALLLEARLEYAPIALFRIEQKTADVVHAANTNARRLVAPGRATDPAALFARLRGLPVDSRTMIAFQTERGDERALAAVSQLTLRGETTRLVALMPVESELEAEALKAWQQLVHVLTHEIMNSLTPVASLSHTAFDLLDELRGQAPHDAVQDLATAMDAIGRRADSLVAFVGSYRSLANLPQPRPELMRMADVFARVEALVGEGWRARGGAVTFQSDPSTLELRADPGQLEQALINLLKNSAEATADLLHPQASVRARLARGTRLRIEVTDNGPGVPDELSTQIFTPFFSTKKHGTGIGLAMVRHLVHANGGTVRYARPASRGARFVITF
ncbi:ATP-binding protein [Massilia arenosa]|uniref:histidine kinase n=1 Tax=Zemynaea arenosa TaxID=2561931 RepID=A0A4Y9SXD7_9BURK|nr:ATP-binding protein [Massilia arenosa]TFW29406.1 ATP-binding protein [Massilia arenosa]